MSGEATWIDPGRCQPRANDGRDRIARQLISTNATVTVDRPEQWTFCPDYRQPGFERQNGAVTRPPVGDGNLATMTELVGLRSSEVQDDAPAFGFHIPRGQADQFGATEAPGKADEQQGPVPDTPNIGRQGIQDDEEVFLQERFGLALGHAV